MIGRRTTGGERKLKGPMRQEGPTTDCGSASFPPRLAMATFAAPRDRARQRSVQRMQPASRFWAPGAYCSKNTKSSMEEIFLFSTFFFCEIQLLLYDCREKHQVHDQSFDRWRPIFLFAEDRRRKFESRAGEPNELRLSVGTDLLQRLQLCERNSPGTGKLFCLS
jgi:hypothetical protein